MNVLIIGDSTSIWNKLLIERTMIPLDWNITFLTANEDLKFKDFYINNNIEIINFDNIDSGFKKVIPKTLWILYALRNKKFDNLIVEYISPSQLYNGWIVKKHIRNAYLAVAWGSDVLNPTDKDVRKNRYLLKKTDGIVLSTNRMLAQFQKDYGNLYNNKIYRAYFGINGYDYIKKYIDKIKTCNNDLNLPNNKVIIAIGYNCIPEQQHDKVLEILKKYSINDLNRIHLVFRMTYLRSGNESYICKIKKMVKELGCTYSFFEDYLSNEDSAKLTVATDIFIHAQTTDALSASIQEHLMAGALVLNPKWIRYDEMEKMNIFYITYKNFNDLSNLLCENINKKTESPYYEKLKNNGNELMAFDSWEVVSKQWQKIYKSVFVGEKNE